MTAHGCSEIIALNLAFLIPTRDAVLVAKSNGDFNGSSINEGDAYFLHVSTADNYMPKFSFDGQYWLDLLHANKHERDFNRLLWQGFWADKVSFEVVSIASDACPDFLKPVTNTTSYAAFMSAHLAFCLPKVDQDEDYIVPQKKRPTNRSVAGEK